MKTIKVNAEVLRNIMIQYNIANDFMVMLKEVGFDKNNQVPYVKAMKWIDNRANRTARK